MWQRKLVLCAGLAVTVLGVSAARTQAADAATEAKKAPPLGFTMTSLDGKDVDLAQYQGKVVLIVNVASECGLTPQYEQLQALHKKFSASGLAILGFPCNQFGKQEPGTESEIAAFCSKNYGVSFDMFSKVEVNGDQSCPLYRYLTDLDVKPQGKGDIKWNFEKFLVDRHGNVIARYAPKTPPDDPSIVTTIETELKKK